MTLESWCFHRCVVVNSFCAKWQSRLILCWLSQSCEELHPNREWKSDSVPLLKWAMNIHQWGPDGSEGRQERKETMIKAIDLLCSESEAEIKTAKKVKEGKNEGGWNKNSSICLFSFLDLMLDQVVPVFKRDEIHFLGLPRGPKLPLCNFYLQSSAGLKCKIGFISSNEMKLTKNVLV